MDLPRALGRPGKELPAMEALLGPFKLYLYATLRIVAGLLFMQHGAQKLFGALGGRQQELFSQFGLAGVVELVGGALIAIGLFASPVAFVASGQMAVAYFQAHAPRAWFPIQNGGEEAALYCFLFLFIAASGSGTLSVDAARGDRR
jgi:putative oxidoreductase